MLSFFALVFALSMPFWILGSLRPFELLPGLPASALAACTPALAALALRYRHGGLPDVRGLLKRAMDYPRIGRRRWLFASLSLNPMIALLAYAAMSAAGESLPRPAPLTPGILVLFVFFFIGALGEELGWSGYATEPLERRWGILRAGLLLGAIWAAWHFVPLAQADRSVSWIASWSVGTIALRTLMVWLYFRSGRSVFATTLFHAMTNLSWQLFRGALTIPSLLERSP